MVVAADSGNFLVTPNVGVMIWTLIAFGVTLIILWKLAFPRIAENLDKRQKAIEDSIDVAERTKAEAEEILSRARKAAEAHERESIEHAKGQRDELMEQTRRDIESETRRAIQEIRNEVADLTVMATEKVTRKTLNDADQKRLVEEALSELDFEALTRE